MKAIRYNEKYYVYKGFFEEDKFKEIIKKGVEYKNYRFYIPVRLKEEFKKTYGIQFTEDAVGCLYFSYKDVMEDYKDDIMIVLNDVNGGFIYINSSNKKIDGLVQLIKLPYFVNNMFEIRGLNLKTEKPFYLVDYIINSSIGIEETSEYVNQFFYNNNSTLYLHQILNRICLQNISFNNKK